MNDQPENPRMGWRFDNSYARLPEALFAEQKPTPTASPKLVAWNGQLAADLGLAALSSDGEAAARLLAGNALPEGALPIAQAYAGHQFGHFTMLGDGRAILLGEHLTPEGRRFDIQLKGAGITPYSRLGDGRAALGPMLREYIVSEAMHGLGIPTTRSLAVVSTGQQVVRESLQPGAVLTRVAQSHLRVGTFQYAAQWGGMEELRRLADYALQRHFGEEPRVEERMEGESGDRYLVLLRRVIARQAELIARWQLVGFIHGVMNTDNMSICGETIDYGPCAFMDAYSPATVFSSIDRGGRYAYQNQPGIGAWNLARLAEALLPLLHDEEELAVKLAEDELSRYGELFHNHWLDGMRGKLGLFGEEADDESLAKQLLDMMDSGQADYTNTFLALASELGGSELRSDSERDEAAKGGAASSAVPTIQRDETLAGNERFLEWRERWKARLGRQGQSLRQAETLMRRSNPFIIPRNYRVEEALEAAVERDDFDVMERLLAALRQPYAYSAEQVEFAALPPQLARPYRTYCGT